MKTLNLPFGFFLDFGRNPLRNNAYVINIGRNNVYIRHYEWRIK
jgi:hypothetical protein